MAARIYCWLLLFLLSTSLVAAAEVRTWTDRQGKTMRAEFVRVHEGRVVLKAGAQTQLVPLSQLSEQDQEYVQKQLNRKSLKDAGDPSDSDPVRIWTDVRGNQTAATFQRIEGLQVVLMESGRAKAVPFTELADKDQDYIKDLLKSRGQEAVVTELERAVEQAKAAAAAAAAAARQSAPSPSPPASNSFAEHMRQQMEAQRQEDERRRQEAEQRSAAERERRQREADEQKQRWEQQRQEANQRWEQQRQETNQRVQEANQRVQEQMARMSTRMSPTMVTEYYCSNCKKQVPENIGAGGSCPHCGVRFDYVETPGGGRQYANNSASGSTSGSGGTTIWVPRGGAIKGIVFIFVAVGSGVAAMWKKITGG